MKNISKKFAPKGNMNTYGLTKERYEQMMNTHGNDKEWVKEIVAEWTPELCNKGYTVFDYDGTGMLEINRIDDVGAFEDDGTAVEQAIKDGVNIIAIEELPENFERRYLGWIDTPENRKRIEEYCSR